MLSSYNAYFYNAFFSAYRRRSEKTCVYLKEAYVVFFQ